MNAMLAVTYLIEISEDLSKTLVLVATILAVGLAIGGRS